MTQPEISTTHPDGAWTVRIRGTVDDTHVHDLEEILDQAVAWGTGDVILDVSGGVNLGPLAIEAVVETRRVLENHQRRLIFLRDTT